MTATEANDQLEDRAKRTMLWYDLVREDERPLTDSLRDKHVYEPASTRVPISRYLSREYHEREREQLWRRVWQMACREEHIPEVGSYVRYDIAGDSYLVVRTRDGIKAYVNACLHRGRALKDFDGRCSEFRCSFHGFTWRLDGTLRYTPAPSEFPDIEADRDAWRLPQAKVGVWGGFVFINPDPDAQSFEEFVGDLPEHFARWDLEHRYVQAHVSKKIRCNWKVAQEAFSEGLHLGATHPQSAPYVGDANCAVDVYGNYGRQIAPSGTPIEDLPLDALEADILKRMLDIREGEDLPIPFEQRSTARGAMAKAGRERWRQVLGDHVDTVSDAEFVDHWAYLVFPNFHPWGGFNRIVYRFRPNGDKHDESIFEVMFLTPYTGTRPPTAETTHLDFGDPWSDAPELQTLGLVMEQDTFNMEAVQRGLETTRQPFVQLSTFQESLVAWRHDLLAQYVKDVD